MQSIPSLRSSCVAVVLTSVLASSTLGCVRLPQTGVQSTGEPLNVEIRTETHTYTTQAKVGEVVNRDSSGRVVGTSEVYENRTGSYDVTRWQAFQGATPIDDQDFFRIGGDRATSREIADYRRTGVSMNRWGLGILAVGGAAVITGLIMSSAQSESTNPSKVPGGLLYGGMILLPVGGILTWIGVARVKREHPIDDPARANAVARKYNQTLGGSSEEEPAPKPKKKKKKKKPVAEDEE